MVTDCNTIPYEGLLVDWFVNFVDRMKFPRGTAFLLPSKNHVTKNSKFDPERLSFFIVIAFFSIFAVIVVVELLYKDFDADTY